MSTPMTSAAFDYIRSEHVASLRIEVQEFRHKITGAPHYHLAADDANNAFLVALRTVPMDSTGVAHILEHTALCGSQRFPVRDPFFMMTRRSLNTFMNAFTSSDWTAYPFASQNKKDFNNLLEVYLDAVFFPTLDALDFAQEGHRLEFAEANNPDSELVYKGVVFNEMKGAMSSPVRSLWDSLSARLFPTITYHYNSGGDPAEIPKLSHDQLKAFHARHYHPSNAIFMTYGDIPAHEHQEKIERLALSRFQRLDANIHVANEQRRSQPLVETEHYALESAEGLAEKTHIVLGWLLGNNTDLDEQLNAHLLSMVLLDNGASPLRHALETTELGNAPSPVCGMDDSTHEMVFVAGVEGSEPEHAEAVEQLILNVLTDIAEHGVAPELLESALHQLELHQREIGGDHYPYGLQLILNALTPAVHGGDPAANLNLDPALERLRANCQRPDFLQNLVRQLLLDNPHRVRLTFVPDAELNQQRIEQERTELAAIKAALSEQDKQQIIAQAQALAARQEHQDNPDVLPKVGLSDIPADLKIPTERTCTLAGYPSTWYAQGTNGLVYQQLVTDLPHLSAELLDVLPVFNVCLTEVGSGGRDYLATQALQAAATGGISSYTSVRSSVDNTTTGRGVFVLGGKALARNQDKLAQLLKETLQTARFDELDRLRELVSQSRMHAEQSATDNGHGLAMMAAASGLSPSAQLAHRWQGLVGIQNIKALDDSLEDRDQLQSFANQLLQLRDQLQQAPRQLLIIGEEPQHEVMRASLEQLWQSCSAPQTNSAFSAPFAPRQVNQAWLTSTQVNFCARAYPTVAADHPDAPALMILGGYLRNGFLHRTIREQGGAYGGGAGYEGDAGAFRFFSYRDPRLAETLADFDRAIDWMCSGHHEPRQLEEAILGVISRIDQPASPAGEAKRAFHNTLHGRTPEQRRRFRSRVLAVTLDDLKRVSAHYLVADKANTAVVCPQSAADNVAALGLEIYRV